MQYSKLRSRGLQSCSAQNTLASSKAATVSSASQFSPEYTPNANNSSQRIILSFYGRPPKDYLPGPPTIPVIKKIRLIPKHRLHLHFTNAPGVRLRRGFTPKFNKVSDLYTDKDAETTLLKRETKQWAKILGVDAKQG
ncbi:hypothetical protein T440DRAFT_482246 [Plenodomus tracheiphilus IPT5]|uniref:Uncharacterized protein n=1 Tax=Plenodomus tracheiphilus IPT5 TaxID=1408161 RepID=A0A6A7AU60_9PLEO|nr:hypothetical protein T440DRAFT_482246 [Plenodomus tracheiphilus IPT5]